MKYEELTEFITQQMRMSHIYQPLLIKSLVEQNGSATIRNLAYRFLSEDESQLQYYEGILKNMPIKILKNHGVIEKNGDLISLTCKQKLSYQEKAELEHLCDQKIQEYIGKRGLSIYDHRLLDTDQISDKLRYRVLKESGFRCELCGATKNDRMLDVDHIKPRSKGGKTIYENLQVLCSKCNRSKGNKDDTDFREPTASYSVSNCIFCYDNIKDKVIEEFDSVVAIEDEFPVSKYHYLIIPKRHCSDYFNMTTQEKLDADALIKILRKRILETDGTVTGFNIGMNSGESAGQTIFHCHIHFIPRRNGDTPNPRGGVRGAIPDKMGY